MHKLIYNNKSYKITVYLKNNTGKRISVDKCFTIQSDIYIPRLHHFTTFENMYFPKYTISRHDNILYLIEIDFCKYKRIRYLLNSLLPTVFDVLFIKRENYKEFLYTSRKLIYEIGYNILGNHKVLEHLNQQSFVDSFSEDEIFEDFEILENSDIIDF